MPDHYRNTYSLTNFAKAKNNYVRYIFILFVAVLTINLIVSINPSRTTGDFDVYYAASKNYLARAPIYYAQTGIEEFKYSPFFALVFSPLVMVGKITSLYLWSILNIFLLYFMFYFLYRLKLISFTGIKDLFIIISLFALSGRYIFANIKIGQVNILLCFLLVLTMYFEINKKDFWAAVTLAFCLMIKLFPLLFLVYFILRRRFKIFGLTLLFISIFLLLPAIYSGFHLNLRYIQEWLVLLRSTPAAMYYSPKNYSLLSFFAWFFVARNAGMFILDYRYITKGLTPIVYYSWVVSCLFLFSSFFYNTFSKRDKDQEVVYLEYACLFVCMLLFNPLAYLNALTILIIPYFFILRSLFYSELGRVLRVAIASLVILSFAFSMSYNKIFFKDIGQFYLSLKYKTPLCAIILVYLCLLLIKMSFNSRLRDSHSQFNKRSA